MGIRPCYVKGRYGLFHKWTEKEDVILRTDSMIPQYNLEKVRMRFEETKIPPVGFEMVPIKSTYALVEFEDGYVEEVPPTTITFIKENTNE